MSTDTSTTLTSTGSAVDHATTVGAIYAAFGRGDVPFIIDQLADDVEWEQGIRDTELPWLQPGVGKDHVLAFFGALGGGLQFTTFEPLTIAQAGDDVVAVIREAAIALATGLPVEPDLYAHVWRFGPDGKVVSFRHIGDWHRQEAAARGSAS
jgi:uncharacterized protein